jgi:hypothetical protein
MFLILSCNKTDSTITPVTTDPSSYLDFSIIEDQFGDETIVLIGSRGRNIIMSYYNKLNGKKLHFEPVSGNFPIVMVDQTGSSWDIFGKAVNGPNVGGQLNSPNAGMGYWFVFGAMFPGLEIHGQGALGDQFHLDSTSEWSIPISNILRGAGFDVIPALEEASFINYGAGVSGPNEPFYLQDDDLIIVVKVNDETKVYPHSILDYHEIINDVIGGQPVSITYCPLSGTAKVWKRLGFEINHSFGVSGLLFNSNILSFDRATESHWTQLDGKCVNGSRKGQFLEILPHIETTFQTWRLFDPKPMIMSNETAYGFDYTNFPYGDYKTDNRISYPVYFDDQRLPRKQRVYCVTENGISKVYQLSDFWK